MHRRHFLATATAAVATMAMGNRAALHAQESGAPEARKLRVAIIGHTGRGDYGHGIDVMWRDVAETEVVAVADANPVGLAAAQKKLSLSQGFGDYRQMLTQIKPDIVAIGMRHIDQHRDAILAAIDCGARGIYIEKEMCRTPAEADEIVAACEKAGAKLGIAHRNRYHPVLPVLAELVKAGEIGRVLEIRARGKEDHRGGGLDLHVLGCHDFNLICYFGGQPVACTGTVLQDGRPIGRADVKEGAEGIGLLAGNEVHARYELQSGIPAFFDSIHDAGVKQAAFGVQLIGTKGIIDLRIDVEPLAHLLRGNPFLPAKDSLAWIPISSAGVGQPEPIADLGKLVATHVLGARDLVAAIRENRPTKCDAIAGRTIIEMICAVFESQRLNGQRVTFPLANRDNPLAQV
jgi:predicted dehydrogenase